MFAFIRHSALSFATFFHRLRETRVVGQPLAWLLVGCLLAVDLIWSHVIGLPISKAFSEPGQGCLVFLLLSVGIRRFTFRAADIAENLALWMMFSCSGCILTYLANTLSFPLQDDMLSRIDDQLVGKLWPVYHDVMLRNDNLYVVLRKCYDSVLLQILFSCMFLPAIYFNKRCAEFFLLAFSGLVITTVISGLAPALGPFAKHAAPTDLAAFLPEVRALREGAPWRLGPSLQGIVTMPSYHVVLALLLTYAYRGTGNGGKGLGPIGWMVAVLNGIMILSVPPIGGHYFVDVLGGAAIALLCILLSRWVRSSKLQSASVTTSIEAAIL